MHLETLRLYCDIVRLRSFSRGAEQNFVSQSAASQAVQLLEAELGVARMDRTERVAAIYSVGLHDVSRHMQRFMSRYPEARVQLECLHPHKVVEAVLEGEADVGIMSYPPADRALSIVPLRAEPMAFVCHPSHRLARRKLVPPADLNGETFIAFDPGLTIRKAIDRALRQHNVKVNIVMEFDNIETIKQAIIINAGVSILPRHTVQKEAGIRTLAVVPLAIPDLVRPVGIIHRRQIGRASCRER